ncbi:hypothetical protein [Phytohabitans rumicis]|nr:hypothetical protein [Phytohabitans rumicis]
MTTVERHALLEPLERIAVEEQPDRTAWIREVPFALGLVGRP